MANENNNGGGGSASNENGNRRGSFTSNTFSALFGRSNSISHGTPATPSAPTAPPALPNASSSMSSSASRQPRRMSITTLGLNAAGTSPMSASTPFFPTNSNGRDRRASVSISSAESGSIDESAIEDDDSLPTTMSSSAQHAQSVPTTPFARRPSFGANQMFGRGGPSPGTAPTSTSTSSHSTSAAAASSSVLFPIPARTQTHHESAPSPSSTFLQKQRTASATLSKPALGPSGLSQGLGIAGTRRTSLSSTSSGSTITPGIFSAASSAGTSLGRTSSGRKPRNLSDLPLAGSSGANGLDWSEQFRSRAESTASRPAHHRASFGANSLGAGQQNTSPNAEARPMAIGGAGAAQGAMHQRAASIGDMSEPKKEIPPVMAKGQEKKSWLKGSGQKPDEVGERILRGEFLMD